PPPADCRRRKALFQGRHHARQRRSKNLLSRPRGGAVSCVCIGWDDANAGNSATRSEEHTSELQSPCNLVCRLLLEKKNKKSIRSETKTLAPHLRLILTSSSRYAMSAKLQLA